MLMLCSPPIVAFTRAEALRGACSVAAGSAAAAASSGFIKPQAAYAAEGMAGSRGISGAVVYDTKTGAFLPADPQRYLTAALKAASDDGDLPRVIFAGEEHTHKLHHALQLEVIKAVDALDDAPTLIGLEMCWRQHQPALDAFVFGDEARGGGDLEKLAKRTMWERTWGYPIELYAPVLSLARERGLRLCGLNAPYAIVQAVSRVGLDGVDPQLRNFLPDVDLTNADHRRRFVEAIGGRVETDGTVVPPAGDGTHGALTVQEVQRSYEAMTLWDEFMASSVAGYVSSEPKRGAGLNGGSSSGTERMVVMVGSSHVRGRVGLPDRYTKRSQLPTFTMVPLSVPWPAVGNKPPAIDQPLGASEADWVLYTKPQEPEDLSFVAARRLERQRIEI